MSLSQINQDTIKNIIDQSRLGAEELSICHVMSFVLGARVDQSVGLAGSLKFRIFSRQVGEKSLGLRLHSKSALSGFFMVTTGNLRPA